MADFFSFVYENVAITIGLIHNIVFTELHMTLKNSNW